jgi:hypothetical protein
MRPYCRWRVVTQAYRANPFAIGHALRDKRAFPWYICECNPDAFHALKGSMAAKLTARPIDQGFFFFFIRKN